MEKKKTVAIPASVVSDVPHLREKTSKIGTIGRAAAIFRVNSIIVYPDIPSITFEREMSLISLLLSYIETPQYLRRALFKLQPELQFAGILPPLRTPHHPLNSRASSLRVGEYREGLTLSRNENGTFAEIGVEHPALIQDEALPIGKRVTLRIVEAEKQVKAELSDRERIQEYWGYDVMKEKRPLRKIMESGDFDLTVATSKYGLPLKEVTNSLAEKLKEAQSVLIAFGAPTRGLHQIAKDEGYDLDDIADFVVNTVPLQGTETVRTEEALIASLAILNMLTSVLP